MIFAYLAHLLPTTLPTHKQLIGKELPTLPTFYAHVRMYAKYIYEMHSPP